MSIKAITGKAITKRINNNSTEPKAIIRFIRQGLMVNICIGNTGNKPAKFGIS